MSYYNTTGENENLGEYTRKALTQDEIIFLYFQNNRGRYGASDIAKAFPNYPITSIRRSLNTLEGNGHLSRPGEKKKGMYARDEYIYTLKTKQLDLF